MTMKQLLFASLFLLITAFGYAQGVDLEQADKTSAPADWKERFFELDREERFALFDDESIDIKEIYTLIEDNRAGNQFRKSAGGGDLFGCEMWYPHDPLEQGTLDGTNWDLFTPACGAGQGVDVFFGPVDLDWDFCFFGTTFNSFYINAKGTLSFADAMCDWTPEAFPGAGFNQIAGFWADFDFTATGLCYWEVTDDAAIVTFVDVGYWPGANGLRNTMQMIITDGASQILPAGYNVGLIYDDMQWAHGGVGGSAGFEGPTPAVVGADRSTGTEHISIGRFNFPGSEYNGPYGEAGGVSWLDDKSFFMMLCDENGDIVENHPPIPTVNNAALNGDWPSIACDTITVCLNDTLPFAVEYLAPEQNENVTVTYDATDALNFVLGTLLDGEIGMITGGFVGTADFIGTHTLYVTATDDGVPAASVTQTFVIQVLDFEAPQIEILGNPVICQGQIANMTVEPADLDYYIWSTGCQGPLPDCGIGYGGLHSETAYQGECSTTAFVEVDVITFPLPCLEYDPSPFACEGDLVEVCFCYPEDYDSMSYECYDEENEECTFGTSELNQPCVEVGPGIYTAIALDANGCEARNIFNIYSAAAEIPCPDNPVYCNGAEPVEFTGGFSNPGGGNLLIYMSDADCEFGEGVFIEVLIWPAGEEDPLDPQVFAMTNACFTANANSQQIELNFGDSIQVTYITSPEDNGNNSVQIFNCAGNNMVFNDIGVSGIIYSGLAECSSDPATGVWSQISCPEDGTFSNSNLFNNIFTPPSSGVYDLSFTEDNCNIECDFTLTFTEPLTNVVLTPGDDQTLCAGDQVDLSVNYTAATECDIEIEWDNANASADPAMATYNHQGNYANETVSATVTNGCSSETVSIDIESQDIIVVDNMVDQTLCDGQNAVINPILADTPDMQYDWSDNQYDGDAEVTTDVSGVYTIVVSNDCSADEGTANIIVAAPYFTNWPGSILECTDESVTLTLSPALPDGYTAIWSPGGSMGDEYVVTSSGTVSVTVADDAGCDTYTSSVDVSISTTPALAPAPDAGETLIICPNEIETLSLNVNGASSFDWTLLCPGQTIDIEAGGTLELGSDIFPQDCLGQLLTLEGTATNECGQESVVWFVMADICFVKFPNIFTPDNDPNSVNNRLVFEGADAYDHVEVYIYDRWGGLVYESLDYINSWVAEGLNDGTYWYIARLMDSTNEVVKETTSNLMIKRSN
jgi:gliding motility-associated-like protein